VNLLTPDFIRSNSLAALEERFGITAKRHPKFPNLVFLKYSQIDSPMAEPICQECRGLILDEADDWRVISFPFRKFFNHGEPNAVAVDWSTARVYEKLDGSLMTLYWYAGEWQVASNGTPDAGGEVFGHGFTFAELFWRAWRENGYRLPEPPEWPEEGISYVFELMTPYNRVVVQHAANRLVLIGVRDLCGFFEHLPGGIDAEPMGWEIVKSFPLACIGDCLTAAEALNPIKSEGFVVCDANFNRVKIKSPRYVALAHLKESASPRRMLEIIRANESDEFLAYFPELQDAYGKVRDRFETVCVELEGDYARLGSIPDQKAFAMEAVKTRCSSALFAVRSNKAKSVRDFFATCTTQAAERAIGLNATRDAIAILAPTESEAI
jgi:hypothetical protein